MQDCILCHWAFDIFNKTLGYEMGIMVVTSGTHGKLPGSWRIPQWLKNNNDAMTELRERVNMLEGYQCSIDETANVVKIKNAGRMRETMLEESESEA